MGTTLQPKYDPCCGYDTETDTNYVVIAHLVR